MINKLTQLLTRARKTLIPLLMVLNLPVFAQSITVSGTVSDENGEGIPGATILVKGTSTGTATDVNGYYSLSAAPDAILVVTYIGYQTTEVAVNGLAMVNISIVPTASSLEEIVVTGYGTQKRRDVTGSIVSIKEQTLREVPSANVIGALQGQIPGVDIARNGVRPGTAGSIRIRGNRSLGRTAGENEAQNSPLIIVDGIPFGGSINDLNPDDIAGLEVLKDASATAIYGSRGSNGVILITTKRGKPGKAQISYNGYVGQVNQTDQYRLLTGPEFKKFKEDARYNAGGGNVEFSVDEMAGIANGTSTDWYDLIYQSGSVMNHELSVAGGSETTQFGLSGGFYKETGNLPGISFNRASIRSTIDSRIGNRIKVGLNTLNTLSNNHGEGINPMFNIMRISPLLSPYLPDGSINLFPLLGTVDGTATANPLTLNNKDAIKDNRRRIRTFNSLYGEVDLIKGLKYRANIGLDYRQDYRGQYRGTNTIINPSGQTQANIDNGEAWSYVIENLLTYEKSFADRHRLTLTGLFSAQEDQGFSSAFQATSLPADYVQEYNFTLANSVVVNNNGNGYSKRGLVSYMGRLNYVLDDKYLLTATLRRDGSSVLSPGNQWFTYPAVAVGWNIANEGFLKNSKFITQLKLRLGWGITSNQSVQPYGTLGGLSRNNYNFGATNVLGYFVSALPNKNLKWESTTNQNLGLDFGLFRDRIVGSIDVYTQNTKDILVSKSLPISNGAGSFLTNAAQTKGNGVEVSISSMNVQTSGGFRWSTDFNFSINREEIVALEEPGKLRDIGNGWFVGQPLTVIYDFKKLGVWQTSELEEAKKYNSIPGRIKLEDANNDGKIDANDMQVLGSFQPDWIGGMTNRISYKNFELSAVMFARMGGNVVATYFQSNAGGAGGYAFFGQGRVNQMKVNYWTPDNPTNEFPQPDGLTNNADYYSTLGYQDGSFIKLRSVNLGYNFPEKLLNKYGLNSLKVYVTAQNPLILYSPFVRDGYGIDPEGTGYGGALAPQGSGTAGAPGRAITVGINTPPTRMFNAGINLKF